MTLPRFIPGQSAKGLLSARTLNELARGVERSSGVAGLVDWKSTAITIAVKNNWTNPISCFHPVGIGGVLSTVDSGLDVTVPELIFGSVDPTGASIWGIAQEDIEVDAVGRVLILGATWAFMDTRVSGRGFGTPGTGYGPIVSDTSGRFEILDSGTFTGVQLISGVLTASGSQPATSYQIYTFDIDGNANGGTVSWEGGDIGSDTPTESGTWDWDQTAADLATSISGLDASASVFGGPWPWGPIKVRLTNNTWLRVSGHALTTETHGQAAMPKWTFCPEAAGWWDTLEGA